MNHAPACLSDETISRENGHATSGVTSEEVKVHIESPETPNQEQEKEEESGPDGTEDKTGDRYISHLFSHTRFFSCLTLFSHNVPFQVSPLFFCNLDVFGGYSRFHYP